MKIAVLGDLVLDEVGMKIYTAYEWYIGSHGYYQRTIRNGKKVLLHRVIIGARNGQLVDHINQNKLDNRLSNLRIANKSINAFNSKIRTDNTTGIRGVSFNKEKRKYEAYITKNGVSKKLGYYKTLEMAKTARLEAE